MSYFFVPLRILRVFATSVIASLPFLFFQMMSISNKVVFLSSFLIYIALIAYDAYFFPFAYLEREEYLKGIIIPYAVVGITSIITHFVLRAFVFNFIFLPFRFLECFGTKTLVSLIVMTIFVSVFTAALTALGEIEAKKNLFEYSCEDIVFFEDKEQ